MDPKINGQQNREISEIKTNIVWLKDEVKCIKQQVSNHIPTKINDLDKKLSEKIDGITSKLFYGFIIGIGSLLMMQVVLKFFI